MTNDKPTVETVEKNQQDEVSFLKEKLNKLEEIFFKVADKRLLHRFLEKDPNGQKIKISLWDGKLVINWKLEHDVVEAKKDGVINERQLVTYTLLAPTKQDPKATEKVSMTYLESVRQTQKVEVDVKKVSADAKTGEKSYVFEYEGNEYEIFETFIN